MVKLEVLAKYHTIKIIYLCNLTSMVTLLCNV
ncbi:unnamed protein product [Mycetohabitans rhizoxinica HKI 454]|uniref:Uncharacterized protein n=1 Tax=Mycetohabitans rhizoxinica (strain DSM 19002 / CIP 109453 / HKI 454) TaxID=882378 RepID=E5ASG0_MYCRK|nr:unnamed protein product [Mycetohabitans rhizoxinica HKI 454]